MVPMKDENGISPKWKKLQVLSTSVAALLIPVVIAFVGHLVNSTLKEQELKLRYVELAVGVLAEEPTQGTSNLRKWAIDVVERNSPVKLPKEAVEELKNESLWSALRSDGLSSLSYTVTKVSDSDTDHLIYLSWRGLRPLKLRGVDVIGGKTLMENTFDATQGKSIRGKFTIAVRKNHPKSPVIIVIKTNHGITDIEIP